LKIARAANAKAMPTKAQIIQEGKYEPKMLREGARSQPLNKHRIGAAPLELAMGRNRLIAPTQNNGVRSLPRTPARSILGLVGDRVR
jgi:hypothetical protein